MAVWLKQSTAVTVKMGPFLDSTDGNTQETALTISQADIRLSKNGGAYAQTNNATGATHDEKGNYGVPLDTTDTNTLGSLRVHIHETGALAVWQDFMVVPANVWDSMFGADLLQIDLTQIVGSAVSTTTAQLGVNTVQAGGTAWASGAITAAAIAADAIGASELAADAVAEIADAVWDEAKAGHVGATTFGDLATDLDTVVIDVAGLDGAAMRGTDSAALASVCTEARLSELDAGTAGKAAAEIDIIKTNVAAILVDTGTDGVIVVTNNDKTGYRLDATGSAALTEGYATDGATATLPQLLYMIWSLLAEANVSGTTLTAKKLDGSTTAATFTLSDATNPTSITRAS